MTKPAKRLRHGQLGVDNYREPFELVGKEQFANHGFLGGIKNGEIIFLQS